MQSPNILSHYYSLILTFNLAQGSGILTWRINIFLVNYISQSATSWNLIIYIYTATKMWAFEFVY